MATVRITHAHRGYAEREIQKKIDSQVKKIEEKISKLDLGRRLYEQAFFKNNSPVLKSALQVCVNTETAGVLFNGAPIEWFDTMNTINCVVQIERSAIFESTEAQPGAVAMKCAFHLPKELPIPYNVSSHHPHVCIHAGSEELGQDPEYQQLYDYALQIFKLKHEEQNLIDTLVRGVLTECTTLRQVLELWPTALEFLPDEVQQKHAEKTPTKRRPKPVDTVTVSDEAKTSLIKLRLLGG